jgi:hypothetical protein
LPAARLALGVDTIAEPIGFASRLDEHVALDVAAPITFEI